MPPREKSRREQLMFAIEKLEEPSFWTMQDGRMINVGIHVGNKEIADLMMPDIQAAVKMALEKHIAKLKKDLKSLL